MWAEDKRKKLTTLPKDVVPQILAGVQPHQLKGLPVNVLEEIKTSQLTIHDILCLTGISTEEAKDIQCHIGDRRYKIVYMNTRYGKYGNNTKKRG